MDSESKIPLVTLQSLDSNTNFQTGLRCFETISELKRAIKAVRDVGIRDTDHLDSDTVAARKAVMEVAVSLIVERVESEFARGCWNFKQYLDYIDTYQTWKNKPVAKKLCTIHNHTKICISSAGRCKVIFKEKLND